MCVWLFALKVRCKYISKKYLTALCQLKCNIERKQNTRIKAVGYKMQSTECNTYKRNDLKGYRLISGSGNSSRELN